ncbi:hypothetical protein PHJA_000396200, partial [Phtheirospermum japonicum]
FFGAQAVLSVWCPQIEREDEFSLSQLWVVDGTRGEGNFNSVEVGWQVTYDKKYPHLFIYWTRDNYQTTGCYDLNCAGFVQTNNRIAFGVEFKPVSSYNGKQYDITLFVWRDRKTGNWWLRVNEMTVGYWPSLLFSLFKDHASAVQFGGEIANTGDQGSHTKTQMGSGHFPEEGYGKAAYIRNIQVLDSKNNLHSAPKLTGVFEKPNCYIAGTGSTSKTWGNYMFYGGPGGKNPACQ